ncbi:hypothetical protein J6590_023059 [Homalodisca vitripennis]|nr:hypothetical protein J6590_023059 [Homalodisca vitripennis]
MDLGPDQLYNADGNGLLQTYENKAESDSLSQNGTNVELNDLREAIIEQLVDRPDDPTKVDVNARLEGADDKPGQLMTEDDIIADVLANSDEEGEEEGGDSSIPATTYIVNMDTFSVPSPLHSLLRRKSGLPFPTF